MLLPIHILLLLLALAPPPPCLAQVLPKFPATEETCVRATAGCKESCVCAVKEVNGVLASYAFENGLDALIKPGTSPQVLILEHLAKFYHENDQVFCKGTKKVMEGCLRNSRDCTFTYGNVSISHELGVKDLKNRCGFECIISGAPGIARGLWIETALALAAGIWNMF